MPKLVEPKPESMPYRFRRPDGTITAKLTMTAIEAEKINSRRHQRGSKIPGLWEPDHARVAWSELDVLCASTNRVMVKSDFLSTVMGD